jgi:CheY-like chemotaxis protein
LEPAIGSIYRRFSAGDASLFKLSHPVTSAKNAVGTMMKSPPGPFNNACFIPPMGCSPAPPWGFPEGRRRGTFIATTEEYCHPDQVGNFVLVVDDDASFREAVTELLRTRGFEIVGYAVDEKNAMEAARSLRPDAILLDATLASCDDFDLVRRLSGPDEGIPVLLTSSDRDAASEPLAQECGAVGFVPKIELIDVDLRKYFVR